MKKILAFTAGLVLALAPTSTASADTPEVAKAWGNCGYTAAGGGSAFADSAGNGFGGHVVRGEARACVTNVFIGPIAGSN